MHGNAIDMTGKTVGALTVVSVAPRRPGHGLEWRCVCQCGESAIHRTAELRGYLQRSPYQKCRHATRLVHGNAFDLEGLRYGRLTMICDAGRAPGGGRLWLCQCDCGEKTTGPAKHIRHGTKTSCGCARGGARPNAGSRWRARVKVDDVYGQLTVLSLAYTKVWRHWLCMCACGQSTVVRSTLLVNGQTKSCGCLTQAVGKRRAEWCASEAA